MTWCSFLSIILIYFLSKFLPRTQIWNKLILAEVSAETKTKMNINDALDKMKNQ